LREPGFFGTAVRVGLIVSFSERSTALREKWAEEEVFDKFFSVGY